MMKSTKLRRVLSCCAVALLLVSNALSAWEAPAYRYYDVKMLSSQGANVRIGEFHFYSRGELVSPVSGLPAATAPNGQRWVDAFDGNVKTVFAKNLSDWQLMYDFGVSRKVDSCNWASGDQVNNTPCVWTVSGSNDGTSWTLLTTITNSTGPSTKYTWSSPDEATYSTTENPKKAFPLYPQFYDEPWWVTYVDASAPSGGGTGKLGRRHSRVFPRQFRSPAPRAKSGWRRGHTSRGLMASCFRLSKNL